MVRCEGFALDLTRLHDILGEDAQRGLPSHLETQSFHAAEQFSLGVTRVRQELGEPSGVLAEPRPLGTLPNEHRRYSA